MALHSVNGPAAPIADEGLDVDADADFFEMSPASAEQVTLQIRSMMERAWEYIAIAYQGRAHIALGYESWDEYVDDRLSDLRLTVPREERGAVVQSLSRAQISFRAIAKVLGVDVSMTAMTRPPMMASRALPLPPNSEVPPMTAAATAYSKVLPAPASGVTEFSRDAAMIPEMTAIAELMTKQAMVMLPTRMPARRAASALPPTA